MLKSVVPNSKARVAVPRTALSLPWLLVLLFLVAACGATIEVTDEPLPGVEGDGDAPQDEVIPLSANVGTTPDCVTVSGRAIYGALAYNHWVYVTNGCDGPVSCTVGTDVSADTASVEVAPGERSETSTFLGSPASAFTPHVDCD